MSCTSKGGNLLQYVCVLPHSLFITTKGESYPTGLREARAAVLPPGEEALFRAALWDRQDSCQLSLCAHGALSTSCIRHPVCLASSPAERILASRLDLAQKDTWIRYPA